MRTYDIIYKKREGKELSAEEIDFLINGYTDGDIPDYQMSAWAMAVFFQGMNRIETANLTKAIVESGEKLNLSSIEGIKVDKHSSGGVGDTTTLVLAPLVSAAGLKVAKLSGRGLGHTGGTIDKLESIPGFRTKLEPDEFIKNVNEIGVAIVSQNANLTPADKKLYALRDVTATVDSIPLIASSIMGKKIAGGADAIVLDVKNGKGAFMKNLKKTRQLARTMVGIGQELGKETKAVISTMEQPLGLAIGNALEVKEAIMTLKDEGPADLKELCLTLGSHMLMLGGKAQNVKEGKEILEKIISSGQALNQFEKFIASQGGEKRIVDDFELLPQANHICQVKASETGYIKSIATEKLGLLSVEIGAGRTKKDDEIDLSAGIILHKKIGDWINKDEVLAEIHLNKKNLINKIEQEISNCFTITEEKVEQPELILDII